jgi:hypothetical protein
MKTMTCQQLGGACHQAFRAETFDEMAALSKKHAMDMFQQGDQPHLEAMKEMQKLMISPESMSRWMDEKRKEFDRLPEDH